MRFLLLLNLCVFSLYAVAEPSNVIAEPEVEALQSVTPLENAPEAGSQGIEQAIEQGTQAEPAQAELVKPEVTQQNNPTAVAEPEQAVTPQATNAQAANKKNEEKSPTFNIFEYRVEGSTVLNAAQIEQAVYEFLGENKTVNDAENARAALEQAFHKAGYLTVFVNIPEQEVNTGVVRLEVQEGVVEKLRVVGSRYYALGRIKNTVSEFEEGKVPYFPTAQKQISSLNATADRKVAPILRPGKSLGKVEIDLKVEDRFPFHGGIELNNRYNANTTPTRLNGSARYDNLWQRDHSIGVSFQITPEDRDETKVLSATYVIPYKGDYWALYGVINKSDVSAGATLNVVGNGNIFGLRYIHPFEALDDYSHSVTIGVDYKDFKETTEILGSDGFNTPIAYLPFTIAYDASLFTKQSTTKLNLAANFSFRGFGNNIDEFAQKRFLAKPNYIFLRTELEHNQKIYKNWELIGKLSGQLTDQSLISNEQFAIGGLDTVRGYLEASAFGDDGLVASVELRTPPLAKYLPDPITEAYLASFYDWGHASVRDALPSQQSSFTIDSFGFGVFLKGFKGMFAGINFTQVLRPGSQESKNDQRVLFRFGYDW